MATQWAGMPLPTAWFNLMFNVGGADFADCKRMTPVRDERTLYNDNRANGCSGAR